MPFELEETTSLELDCGGSALELDSGVAAFAFFTIIVPAFGTASK